jgi:hypothetical protein
MQQPRAGISSACVSNEWNPSGLPTIWRTLGSARSFDEYVAMFDLTDNDLRLQILDCAAGTAKCLGGWLRWPGRGRSVHLCMNFLRLAPRSDSKRR